MKTSSGPLRIFPFLSLQETRGEKEKKGLGKKTEECVCIYLCVLCERERDGDVACKKISRFGEFLLGKKERERYIYLYFFLVFGNPVRLLLD